ncbi:MAG: site-specific integrase [Flavobacteriales bacterium]
MYIAKFLKYISCEKRYYANTVANYSHDLNEFYPHLKHIGYIGTILEVSKQNILSFIISLLKKSEQQSDQSEARYIDILLSLHVKNKCTEYPSSSIDTFTFTQIKKKKYKSSFQSKKWIYYFMI